MSLEGKTALVTGAAGAIGGAVAQALAREGADVILLDRDRSRLEAMAGTIGADRARGIAIDLADLDAVKRQGDAIAAEGGVDILINNAGILSNHKLEQTELDEWRRVMMVNLDAAYMLTRALIQPMRVQRWGRIINMSSLAAKSGGLTAGTAYSVSKSALIGLTFTVARECAADGVTVNAVAPAYVMSPMISEQLSEEQRRDQLAAIPVGRFCTPEEVAHAVSFLASPLAGFITGEVIDMNGGLQFD